MSNRILVINPGSTSTKFGLFEDETALIIDTIRHDLDELNIYRQITDQLFYRRDVILRTVKTKGFDCTNLKAVIGRGGLIRPVTSGTYIVNDRMKRDLHGAMQGEHASNLGGLIAAEIAKDIVDCQAFIADPVVVDELMPEARITGHPLLERKSIFHALNQKAVARTFAKEINANYEDLNLIVCHMGGGITIGAHQNGMVVDVNNGLDGYGPISPERAGTLPAGALVKLCYSGKYTLAEMKQFITGKGGMMAHTGSNSIPNLIKKAEIGDDKCKLLLNTLIYQVSKEIAGKSATLFGKVDAILLTGGIANSKLITNGIEKRVGFIAPVKVYPGEDEILALAQNALRVLKKEVEPLTY